MPCRCDYPEPDWKPEYQKIYKIYHELAISWGWRPLDEKIAISKSELDEKTEALCKYLNSRRKATLEKFSPFVKQWLNKHNEKDAARKQEEKVLAKAKKKFEKQRQDNIKKMTPAERKLFG